MSHPLKFISSFSIDRRRLLWSAAAASAVGAVIAAGEGTAEPVGLTTPERPRTNLAARNIGLITAYRSHVTPAENKIRNRGLWSDITPTFGRLLLRGRYIENSNSFDQRTTEVEAFLVFGNTDDSGNLKGLLRKLGRKYDQDAVIHKPYYQDARLYALRDLPDLDLRNQKAKTLGCFRPDRIGYYYTLMTRRGLCPGTSPLLDFSLYPSLDWLGGRWEDIGFWAYRGRLYAEPSLRRVSLDEAGVRDEG